MIINRVGMDINDPNFRHPSSTCLLNELNQVGTFISTWAWA